jgi:hypothetical protein
MKTILLLSLLIGTFAVPPLAARSAQPVRALKSLALFFLVFTVAYTLYVAFVHTTYYVPHR